MCEKFPGITPFSIRRTRAAEVFLLMRRLADHSERKEKEIKKNHGSNVIRRPAGDDWF